jgi:hypothetical protein
VWHSEHVRRTLADNARQMQSGVQDHSSTTDGHQIGNMWCTYLTQVSQRGQRPTGNQIRRTKYSNNVHRIRPLVETCDISSYKACRFYRSVPVFSHPNSVSMYTLHGQTGQELKKQLVSADGPSTIIIHRPDPSAASTNHHPALGHDIPPTTLFHRILIIRIK